MTETNKSQMSPVTQAATLAKAPLNDAQDIRRIVGALERIMDALDGILEEETQLIKEGKVKEASEIVEAKNQLSIQYMLLQKTITANASLINAIAPQESELLQRKHFLFSNTLRVNLAVVSTAREVSDELVGTLNKEVQKGNAAQTYSNTGNMPAQPKQGRGIAIDTAS